MLLASNGILKPLWYIPSLENTEIANMSRAMSWSKPYHSNIRNMLAQQRERVYGPSSDSVLEIENSRYVYNAKLHANTDLLV